MDRPDRHKLRRSLMAENSPAEVLVGSTDKPAQDIPIQSAILGTVSSVAVLVIAVVEPTPVVAAGITALAANVAALSISLAGWYLKERK